MKNSLIVAFALLLASCATSRDYQPATDSGLVAESLHDFSAIITSELLKEHLYVIAGDGFQGRGTGQAGIDLAADYIVDFYQNLSIPGIGDSDGGYFQEFNLFGQRTSAINYTVWNVHNGDSSVVYRGTFSNESRSEFTLENGGGFDFEASIVFVGKGLYDSERGINHFAGDDVRGKWVMFFEDILYVSDGDTLVNPQFTANNRIRRALLEEGARGIITIPTFESDAFLERNEGFGMLMGTPSGLSLNEGGGRGRFQIAIVSASPSMAVQLLGLEGGTDSLRELYESISANPAGFAAKSTSKVLRNNAVIDSDVIPARNIAAVIEGGDPILKNEYVVLTAHYDHMGISSPDDTGDFIYNGADDNGSGTVALMAVGRALAEARNAGWSPKRSIILLHVSAEEVGLLGSRYYSDNPTVPIESIIANLNVDMIGRIDEEQEALGKTDYVYIIGAEIISSDMNRRLDVANEFHGNAIELNMKYNDLNDRNQFYRRSDHWNFGRLGIPFIFYFTGVHADYHRPSDTPDKIYYDKYSKIVRLVYSTAIEISDTEERPVVDSEEFIRITQSLPR